MTVAQTDMLQSLLEGHVRFIKGHVRFVITDVRVLRVEAAEAGGVAHRGRHDRGGVEVDTAHGHGVVRGRFGLGRLWGALLFACLAAELGLEVVAETLVGRVELLFELAEQEGGGLASWVCVAGGAAALGVGGGGGGVGRGARLLGEGGLGGVARDACE